MTTACPCCHGSGWLVVHDDRGLILRRDLCTHCMGQGEVATELNEPARAPAASPADRAAPRVHLDAGQPAQRKVSS